MAVDRTGTERAIEDFLRSLGHAPEEHQELAQTPQRVAQAWSEEFLDGYDVDVPTMLSEKSTPLAPTHGQSLVILHRSETNTFCPHHLLPAIGHATVVYLPGERLTGLGTLARVVDAFAHRLSLQEQIGEAVVDALFQHLGARFVLCKLQLKHTCLMLRGARKQALVETIAVRGELLSRSLEVALQAALHHD
jgi:GTP cyclohydrolase IA